MKKNPRQAKLSFEKITIANLTGSAMAKIAGGETANCTGETDTSVIYSKLEHCTANPTLRPPTKY